jgi:hypothetical protein
MKLIESRDQVHILPATDHVIETGEMGDCITVIVYYNPTSSGNYADVVAQHGKGGIFNWTQLLSGAQGGKDPVIVIIPGSVHKLAITDTTPDHYKELARTAFKNVYTNIVNEIKPKLQNARFIYEKPHANVRYNRAAKKVSGEIAV